MVNQSSGRSRSYWLPSVRSLVYEPLTENLKVDVAIIGAGITGLSAAYTLIKLGRSVAVLEDGLVMSGETSRTSGHLSSYIDGRLTKLKNLFGIDALRLVIDSHIEAIDRIEKISKVEEISCEFKRVNGFLFGNKKQKAVLDDEAKILEELNNQSFEWIEKAPFKKFDTGPCIKFSRQAQFNPVKYLQGLQKAIIDEGGQIFESTHVTKIKAGRPCTLMTEQGAKITATDVIVATNSPINNKFILQTKQAQYRTYVMGIAIPKGELEEGLYWDTDEPYHYIRLVHSPKEDEDYVLIGGEDHKTGQNSLPKKSFDNLKKWTSKRFSKHEIIYEWSGQVIEPIDNLAFTGRNPGDQHIYVHTGASGSGLTYGTIAGLLIPELIVGNNSPLEKIYDPSRKTIKAIGQFAKESSNTAVQYFDWVKPKSMDTDKIPPHEGAVIRRGTSLEAVYKDVDGHLHRMSAICPHLGGIVRFNTLEQTWDCPCHGSRFNAFGDVINGPANCGLKRLK